MQIAINNRIWNVRDEGEGDTALLFLHYFGGSSRSWSEVIPALAARFRCVAPDLPGAGASNPPAYPYTVKAMADDVSGLVDGLHLGDVTLVGHSMGGKIALEVATWRPSWLRSLLLLAPSPPTPEPMDEADRARLLAAHGQRASALETLGKITANPLPTPLLETAVEDNLRTSEIMWRSWLEVGSRQDISARMAAVSVPITILSGEKDPVIPTDFLGRSVLPHLPTARLEMVPAAGHLLPMEAPNAVRQWVNEATGH